MRYQLRPTMVDAVVYDGHLVGELDERTGRVRPGSCPEWLNAIIPQTHPDNLAAASRPGVLFYAGEDLRISTRIGSLPVNPGDWLVRDQIGIITPLKHVVFMAVYDPVPEPVLQNA